jgi:predicted ATPase/class 3 adenylate cyclase
VREAPRGTVTFFFTDLESSTPLWERHPEAMRAALADHDAILKAAIEGQSGYLVKSTGDGAHAVFGSAHDAVAGAVAAQRALLAHTWNDVTGPLRVRMGLHTGEAEVRDGDYFGAAVNRAARVMSAGHGGQILCSAATAGLVDDDPVPGVALVDLGEQRLKGFSRPERIYQVCADDLPQDFASLRTDAAAEGNLPAQLASFIGREHDVAGVEGALDEARLVTLTGVGGVGKTSLALEVATRVRDRYPDGVWWCELAPAGDADALAQVVVASLGVSQQPGLSLDASIVELLRMRSALLVFDNCEHIIDDVGALAGAILGRCPRVRILSTSREALALDAERVWPLRSLSVPSGDDVLEELESSEAALLFIDRVRASVQGFTVDASNAPAIAEICRRLDGIPLALVLAAARASAMSPGEIASHLDERFRLLTGGRRQGVERHRTLRATIDWSFSMLTEVEQAVFARLSLFAGTFDAAAASAVASGDKVESWDVLDALASLVAKSMLTTEVGSAGPTRYRMLETLRQYGEDQLEELGEGDRWRQRFAERYAAFAEDLGHGLRSAAEAEWRPRLGVELDNLRAAVTWALDRGGDDAMLALRIIAALEWESARGDTVGVGAWAERAIDDARRASPGMRCDILSAASWAAIIRGDIALATEWLDEAISEGDPMEAQSGCVPYVSRAYLRVILGDHQGAVAVAEDAMELFGDDVPLAEQVTLITGLAGWRFFAGDVDGARRDANRAVALAREHGGPSGLSMALFIDAVTFWRDDPERGAPVAAEAIELVETGGAMDTIYPLMLAVQARIRALTGDPEGARRSLRTGLEHVRRRGDQPMLATVLNYAIPVLRERGGLETVAVIGGAVYDGPLAFLRNIPPPEDASARSVIAAVREEMGDASFDAAAARGAAMSIDELCAVMFAELDRELASLD